MTVYLIGCEGSRLVKIGHSRNPAKRLAELARMSASPVKLLWQSGPEHGMEAEQHLHRVFRSYRQHGEWFDFGEDDPVELVNSAISLPVAPSLRRGRAGGGRDWSGYTRQDLTRALVEINLKRAELRVAQAECCSLMKLMDEEPDAQTVAEAAEQVNRRRGT